MLLADDLMVGEKPVLLANGRAVYNEWRVSILAVQEVPAAHTRRYGIVAGTPINDHLLDVSRHRREARARRRALRAWAWLGRYILTPGVFHEIATQQRGVGGEIQLTDGIAALLRREKGVRLPLRRASAIDCGSKEGFLEANVELALDAPGQLGPSFRAYLKSLDL